MCSAVKSNNHVSLVFFPKLKMNLDGEKPSIFGVISQKTNLKLSITIQYLLHHGDLGKIMYTIQRDLFY